MQETFYATFAQISFGLLGLWWVVVQLKHARVVTDPALRRTAYNVSLFFALPAIMSLMSLLSADATLIWRSAFLLAAALGLVEGLRDLRTPAQRPAWATAGRWIAVAFYALVIVVAAFPGVVAGVGLPLTPIQVEGLLLSVIVFLGVNLAWQHFVSIDDAP